MKNRKALIGMAIVFLAIGFATISTTLIVNGILALGESNDFEIIFTSAKLDGRKRNDFISSDKKHIEFTSNTLTDIDDETKLVYEVTNTSRNYDANVSVRCTAGENEYIMFNYTPLEMKVLAGETKSGTLTASMLKVTDVERDIPIECTLTAEATERESLGDEYIEPFSRSGVLKSTTGSNTSEFWRYRGNITKVVFEDKMIAHETEENLIFDVSEVQDKSVMAYLVTNGGILSNDTVTYDLYIQSDTGVKANPNSESLFNSFSNLAAIYNMKYLDTSSVTNMDSMFYNCVKLTTLDLSDFDTGNVTSMGGMFANCSILKTLDLSSFDTSNVTNMGAMFRRSWGIASLNLSSFDTSKVTNMVEMFYELRNLKELDLSSFYTPNLTNMGAMFKWCSSLTYLNIENFDTSNVTKMNETFSACSKLLKLDVSNFNTSNVTSFASMFNGCNSLRVLDVRRFDTTNATNISNMFSGCTNVSVLDLSNFNTSNVTNMSNMFNNCKCLTELDVSNFDTSKVTNVSYMFISCINLKALNVSNWDTSNVTNMSFMFAYCENLEELDVSNFNISNVTDMSSMFGYLRKVDTLDVSNWDTSKVTTMRAMFVECNELKSLNLDNWDLTNVTNLNSFVSGCHVLNTTITIRGTNCTNYAGENGYWAIFFNAATNGNIIVNYTADASSLVDEMIATKSDYSKVYKGVEVL